MVFIEMLPVVCGFMIILMKDFGNDIYGLAVVELRVMMQGFMRLMVMMFFRDRTTAIFTHFSSPNIYRVQK
jgi:hypothetical protein